MLASHFEDQRRRATRRKEKSGGDKETANASMAGKDDVRPSWGFFGGGGGSREGSLISKLCSDAEMMLW